MQREYSCDPGLELTGNAVVALISSINCDNYLPILEEYHFQNIDPNSWYSLDKLLEILIRIGGNRSGMMDLVSIGMEAGARSNLPNAVLALSPHKFLEVYASVYPQRHRGGDPGWMRIEQGENNSSRIISNTPYPDDLFYGLMYGLLKRVVKPGEHVVMRYRTRQDHCEPETIMEVSIKR
jgi:hypothetical protein